MDIYVGEKDKYATLKDRERLKNELSSVKGVRFVRLPEHGHEGVMHAVDTDEIFEGVAKNIFELEKRGD